MALRAGYYGVKRRIYEKALSDIDGLKSVDELTGAVNMFVLVKGSDTINGVTYTVNDDKTVTVNNTATANSLFIANDNLVLPAGVKYRISKGIKDTNPQVNVNAVNGTTFVKNLVNLTTQDYLEFTPDYDGYDHLQVIIYVPNGTAISNKKISIMITLPNYIPDDYVPGAMTNQQLTASANDQKTAINAIISAATGAADFAAFKTAMAAISPVTRSVTPETRGEVEDDPEPVTKTTRSTKKTATTKEGE